MRFRIFISYARADQEPHLHKFFSDLRSDVRAKTGLPSEDIQFVDTSSIQMGDDWNMELAEALRTAPVCVSICSQSYLNSRYCGKELQIFCDRRDAWLRDPARSRTPPRVIFPIVWEMPPQPLPSVISRFQYSDDGFPDAYTKHGLRLMTKLSRFRDPYLLFVDKLARKLVEATQAPMPPAPIRPQLNSAKCAWDSEELAVDQGMQKQFQGLGSARFVYVVGTKKELAALRGLLDCYDERGGSGWRPFFPISDASIGAISEAAASRLRCRYSELPIDTDLIDRLRKAEADQEAVVLIADVWSAKIDGYQLRLEEFDRGHFANCELIVPWNSEDPEANKSKTYLEQALRQALPRKFSRPPLGPLWDSLRTPAALAAAIERALTQARMAVLEFSEAIRKAENEDLVLDAQKRGVCLTSKPTIGFGTRTSN